MRFREIAEGTKGCTGSEGTCILSTQILDIVKLRTLPEKFGRWHQNLTPEITVELKFGTSFRELSYDRSNDIGRTPKEEV